LIFAEPVARSPPNLPRKEIANEAQPNGPTTVPARRLSPCPKIVERPAGVDQTTVPPPTLFASRRSGFPRSPNAEAGWPISPPPPPDQCGQVETLPGVGRTRSRKIWLVRRMSPAGKRAPAGHLFLEVGFFSPSEARPHFLAQRRTCARLPGHGSISPRHLTARCPVSLASVCFRNRQHFFGFHDGSDGRARRHPRRAAEPPCLPGFTAAPRTGPPPAGPGANAGPAGVSGEYDGFRASRVAIMGFFCCAIPAHYLPPIVLPEKDPGKAE